MKKLLGVAAVVAIVLSVGFGSAVAAEMIRSGQIKNFTIRANDMKTGSVNSRVIKNSTIRARDMATGAVDGRVVKDGTVGTEDLSTAAKNELAFATVPSGQTIRGAVGGDFDASAPITDWGVIASLPAQARNALSDDDVFINVAGWQSGDVGQVQPTTTDTNAGCSGSPANPTAPVGKICIYVAGGDNAQDVNGYSVLPGTGASPYGFKLKWENPGTGDTFIDAVWAYTAP